MTATIPRSAAESVANDANDLAQFGYKQQLHRRLGGFASFAAGFSFVSILTTVFQLFGLGFSFGGPAFFWAWPVVFAGQLLVALCFAEMAAHYPIAGCIYQWSRRLSTAAIGWFAGWLMLIGQIVSVAAAAIALQVVLPAVWTGFQLIGTDPSLTSSDGAGNAVLLGTILIVITTLINAVGVRVMAMVNSIGVICELVGIVLLVGLLFVKAERSPAVLTQTLGVEGSGSYLWPLLISALMAAYVMIGFDSAGELSEETRNPRRNAPRAILRALIASGVGGAFLIVAALMAAPSVDDGELATGGLPYVLTSRLGTDLGKLFLLDVAIAVCVCTLAIQTASTRLVFSMSRDGALPFSKRLSAVNAKTGAPILPAVVIGVLAVALLVVNVGQGQLFLVLSSVAVVIVYLAYLLVTVPMLIQRFRGWPHQGDHDAAPGIAHFSLGRWGKPINIVAVVYGVFMAVNMAWPRAAVYDPAGEAWYFQYFAPIFLLVVLVLGALAYKLRTSRRDPIVLPEQAVATVAPVNTGARL